MIFENTEHLYDLPSFPFMSLMVNETYTRENHCHKAFEIVQILRSTAKVVFNHRTYRLEPGDLFFVPPYANHAYWVQDENARQHTIIFDLDIVDTRYWPVSSAYEADLANLDGYSTSWAPDTRHLVSEMMVKMHTEYTRKAFAWQLAIQSLASEMLLTLMREVPRNENAFGNKQVAKMKNCIEYITANLASGVTASGCARAIGMGASHFSVFFKGHMGTTFQEYVRAKRIEKATFLLMSTDIPINDVCYESGYSDIRTFDRAFKRETSHSPTAYRKLHGQP